MVFERAICKFCYWHSANTSIRSCWLEFLKETLKLNKGSCWSKECLHSNVSHVAIAKLELTTAFTFWWKHDSGKWIDNNNNNKVFFFVFETLSSVYSNMGWSYSNQIQVENKVKTWTLLIQMYKTVFWLWYSCMDPWQHDDFGLFLLG